jgi:putative endonuclease
MMESRKQEIGRWGEQLASEYLAQKGYKILGRNIRTPYGEIDILALLDQTLIFVEVKTRTSNSFGNPENAITTRKLTHMEASALHYTQNIEYAGTWQWDAIAILKLATKPPEIVHFENVIS